MCFNFDKIIDMRLKSLELSGFKSFGKKTTLLFDAPITAIVGPNGSGKSNVAESFRWVLGEQSLKSLRGKKGEDLIFNGGESATRASRASVSVVFDNSDKSLPVEFAEVMISRVVHRDGVNEYLLNGSPVRLRDVVEILSHASLGSSGHHIINQGEADRILNSNIYERKTMVEDALGLKLYHFKIEDSERKLERTETNIKEVESLRREIAPHIKFLKKQVEKIEKADSLRKELKDLYKIYLPLESFYLKKEADRLSSIEQPLRDELSEIEIKLTEAEKTLTGNEQEKNLLAQIEEAEKTLREVRERKNELLRESGRLDGMIEARMSLAQEFEADDRPVPFAEIQTFLGEISQEVDQALSISSLEDIKNIVTKLKERISAFLSVRKVVKENRQTGELESLKERKESIGREMFTLSSKEETASRAVTNLRSSWQETQEVSRGAEKNLYEMKSRRTEIRAKLDTLNSDKRRLDMEKEDFDREIKEGMTLVDREVGGFGSLSIPDGFDPSDRQGQEDRRRSAERLKIRLEDMGGESVDVLEEYKEATARDEYLEKELVDLKQSAESLRQISVELKAELETRFSVGLEKINEKFADYFKILFGGGEAKVSVVKPEPKRRSTEDDLSELVSEGLMTPEDNRTGVEIKVNLPRKKVRALEMLSGGERALTAIALSFAVASVNPPPFLILDETDAALDEANSKKYADMVATLAQTSQLIVITHNRETMSRAGILYGVTMGGDGVSKLLSVRFEDATQYAK